MHVAIGHRHRRETARPGPATAPKGMARQREALPAIAELSLKLGAIAGLLMGARPSQIVGPHPVVRNGPRPPRHPTLTGL
jgi:hypothetical protein